MKLPQGVEDELVIVRLDTLDNVRMGSDDEIRSTVNELVRERSLRAALHRAVFDTPSTTMKAPGDPFSDVHHAFDGCSTR